jgi:hypothetical protein
MYESTSELLAGLRDRDRRAFQKVGALRRLELAGDPRAKQVLDRVRSFLSSQTATIGAPLASETQEQLFALARAAKYAPARQAILTQLPDGRVSPDAWCYAHPMEATFFPPQAASPQSATVSGSGSSESRKPKAESPPSTDPRQSLFSGAETGSRKPEVGTNKDPFGANGNDATRAFFNTPSSESPAMKLHPGYGGGAARARAAGGG